MGKTHKLSEGICPCFNILACTFEAPRRIIELPKLHLRYPQIKKRARIVGISCYASLKRCTRLTPPILPPVQEPEGERSGRPRGCREELVQFCLRLVIMAAFSKQQGDVLSRR